jgi:hypothetical protein
MLQKPVPLPALALALACSLAAGGCGVPGGGGEETAAPPPPPPTSAAVQPVPVDDADVPKAKGDTTSEPEPPPLPDGSRSTFLPKAQQKRIIAAFFKARSLCRRKRDAVGRVSREETFEQFLAAVDREEARLKRNVAPFERAFDTIAETFKAKPDGAVKTRKGPHTLFELMDMTGDMFARDCDEDDGAGANYIDRLKRKYGRKYLD